MSQLHLPPEAWRRLVLKGAGVSTLFAETLSLAEVLVHVTGFEPWSLLSLGMLARRFHHSMVSQSVLLLPARFECPASGWSPGRQVAPASAVGERCGARPAICEGCP